jgi:hypothetical protein
MPKKTLALIIVLAIVTFGLVFLGLRSSPNESNQTQTNPTEQPTIKTARLYFEPNQTSISALARTSSEIPVLIDSGGSEVSGVQVELQYNPALLTNVEFVAASAAAFFDYPNTATILTNTVDSVSGRVSYVVSIAPNTDPLKGTGEIGVLKFQASPTAQSTQTSIVFSPDSAVTSLTASESILKEATPLQLSITRTQSTITPRTSTGSGAFR